MLVNYGIPYSSAARNFHFAIPLANKPFANEIPKLIQILIAETSVQLNMPDEIDFLWPNNSLICLLSNLAISQRFLQTANDGQLSVGRKWYSRRKPIYTHHWLSTLFLTSTLVKANILVAFVFSTHRIHLQFKWKLFDHFFHSSSDFNLFSEIASWQYFYSNMELRANM